MDTCQCSHRSSPSCGPLHLVETLASLCFHDAPLSQVLSSLSGYFFSFSAVESTSARLKCCHVFQAFLPSALFSSTTRYARESPAVSSTGRLMTFCYIFPQQQTSWATASWLSPAGDPHHLQRSVPNTELILPLKSTSLLFFFKTDVAIHMPS